MNRTNLNIVAEKLACMCRANLNAGWKMRHNEPGQRKRFEDAAKCDAGAQMISRMALSVNS